jgi:hypothetical protein
MKLICEVEGCGIELSEGTGSKGGPHMCPACRTSSYYWNKQDLDHMRERHVRLGLFRNRLEHYNPRVTKILNDAKKAVAHARQRAHAATAIKH